MEDLTGEPNEIGWAEEGNWKARGMKFRLYRTEPPYYDMTVNAGHSSGCFVAYNVTKGYTYKLQYWAQGNLRRDSGNRVVLKVMNQAGATGPYGPVSVYLGNDHYPDPIPPTLFMLPGMYVRLAYVIENRFRGYLGYYGTQSINVYHCNEQDPEDCDPGGCADCYDGANNAIILSETAWWRKFVSAHEYGHANLWLTAGSYVDDCSYGAAGSGQWHALQSLEYTSCAAMEGFAHFVATVAWNDKSGSNPAGWFHYWGQDKHDGYATDVFDMEYGSGSCADHSISQSDPVDNDAQIEKYTECCYCGGGCSQGCDTVAAEYDWARFWWDYHTNDFGQPGEPAGSAQIQDEIEAALDWSSTNTCDKLYDGIGEESGSSQQQRYWEFLDANGIQEPGCDQ